MNLFRLFSFFSLFTLLISSAPVRVSSASDLTDNVGEVQGTSTYIVELTKTNSPKEIRKTRVNPHVLKEKNQQIEDLQAQLKKTVLAKRARQKEVVKLVAFLSRQRSPIATEYYADIIIETSMNSGVDYKILVAIMGQESGFCRANVLKYNCFGYLNTGQYSGFEAAFRDMIPKIANQYVKVYGTDFVAMAKAYGVHSYEYHGPRTAGFYRQLASM